MLKIKDILVIGHPSINGYNDVCAICREHNMMICIGCQANSTNTECYRLMGNCGHVFHAHCIQKWTNDHPTCPLCNKIWTNVKKV